MTCSAPDDATVRPAQQRLLVPRTHLLLLVPRTPCLCSGYLPGQDEPKYFLRDYDSPSRSRPNHPGIARGLNRPKGIIPPGPGIPIIGGIIIPGANMIVCSSIVDRASYSTRAIVSQQRTRIPRDMTAIMSDVYIRRVQREQRSQEANFATPATLPNILWVARFGREHATELRHRFTP